MSPTVRTGLIFGLGAALAVIGAQLLAAIVPIPCMGILSVIAIGIGAGYTINKVLNSPRERRVGRGATVGAIAGVLALVGTVIAVLIGINLPSTQAAIEQGIAQAQTDPDFANSGIDPAQIAAFATGAGGIIGGFCGGILNLVFMVIAGLVGGLLWKGAAATPEYVGAGGSAAYNQPPAGGYIPSQSGGAQQYTTPSEGQTPGDQDAEGGAKVYGSDDPNRPTS